MQQLNTRAPGRKDTEATHNWVLTLNAGSSSLKFALFDQAGQDLKPFAMGQIEGIGLEPHLQVKCGDGKVLEDRMLSGDEASDHQHALAHILEFMKSHFPSVEISAVGHRVVHGGTKHAAPVVVTDAIIDELSASSSSRRCISPTTWQACSRPGRRSRTRFRSPASTRRSTASIRG